MNHGEDLEKSAKSCDGSSGDDLDLVVLLNMLKLNNDHTIPGQI